MAISVIQPIQTQTITGVVQANPHQSINIAQPKQTQTVSSVVQASPQTMGPKPAVPPVPQIPQAPNINQKSIKGSTPVDASLNQQPAQPNQSVGMKPGILSINKAIGMGASPLQVLAEISKQNINKNRTLSKSIRTALTSGANPNDVLDEILKQNGGQTQKDYKDYTTPKKQPQPGMLGLSRDNYLDPNVVFGFGKGIAQAYGEVGNIIGKPLDKAYEAITGQTPAVSASLTDEQLKPKSAPEGIGKFAGQAQQFALGAEGTKPLVGAVENTVSKFGLPSLGKKLISTFARSLIGGGEGYGISRLQGVNKEDATTNALIAGTLPWVGAGFSALKESAGALGEKIQTAVIKPSKADLADGFKIENVNKYKLGGNLAETADKVQGTIKNLVTELKTKIKPGTADVDLNKVGSAVIDKFSKATAENAGSNMAIQRELQKFIQEIDALSPNGIVDIADAQLTKQGFGAQGAWQWNIPLEDANAKEQIYNFAYNQIKKEIEAQGAPGIAAINKQLSELIPIQNAVIRRIPIAARSNPLSLTDIVSLIKNGPGGLTLFSLNRLLKSGKIGSALSGLVENPETRSGLGTTILGAGTKDIKGDIPKLNAGLSIESVNPKIQELGQKISQLNTQWVQNPTPVNKKALLNAKSLYFELLKKIKS